MPRTCSKNVADGSGKLGNSGHAVQGKVQGWPLGRRLPPGDKRKEIKNSLVLAPGACANGRKRYFRPFYCPYHCIVYIAVRSGSLNSTGLFRHFVNLIVIVLSAEETDRARRTSKAVPVTKCGVTVVQAMQTHQQTARSVGGKCHRDSTF